MASTLAFTTRKGVAIIPLKPRIDYDKLEKVKLFNYVAVGPNQTEKRQASIHLCNKTDPELILRTIVEFMDMCNPNRLHLASSALRFTKFRECLGEEIRIAWDALSPTYNITGALQDFQNALDALIMKYFPTTALADQRYYFTTVIKPVGMKVSSVHARLTFINLLARWLPGANHISPFDANLLKELFFHIMPCTWQETFTQTGNDISNAAYTLDQLLQYMMAQETIEISRQELHKHLA